MKNKHFNLTSGIVLILIPLFFPSPVARMIMKPIMKVMAWSVNQATKSLPSS